MLVTDEVLEVSDFVIKNSEGLYNIGDIKTLEDIIGKHLLYGTATIIRDYVGIAAVARWNWEPNGVAFVLDCIIRSDLRDRTGEFLKRIILVSVRHNPQCRFIKFARFKKYPDKKPRVYSLTEIFKLLGRRN